ncbi:FKBP-type peptidyl-prolyl cis-trans isomerase [Oleiharenicola sp. Vm1]|uniref:FKBP-type peptidyl-prolyl cis-trans isomerase n=1 Tax=Oleiharenicola sp. Vm1 TaxID=3398393 RepID=UPI0039F515B2
MKRLVPVVFSLAALVLAGCGPKEPAAPAAPEKSVAEERRENWFGAKLAADPTIQWRDSGLGIQVLRAGEGPTPQRTDKVRVNYVGRLLDGTEFDRSAAGKPAVFSVQNLVTGLAAGVTTMRAGGKAVFYIPPHLGYGGIRAGKIPPNSSLVFEVELLEVNPKD